MVSLQSKIFVTLLTLAIAGVPAGAFAQAAPSGLPSYAAPASASDTEQETIHGQIASYDGAGNLQLNDDRGFVDIVSLGRDTIVNADRSRLQPGTVVTIVGVARGSVFAADRIDIAGLAQQQLQPQQPQQPQQLAPPPPEQSGSVVTGNIGVSIDSKNAYVGEPVVLHDLSSSDGPIAGATLRGTVTDVTQPGQGRNAQIRMHFDSLRYPDGTTKRIDGVVLSVDVKTKSNAAKEVGGALIGLVAGNIIGSALGIGAGSGGVLGAAGGYFVAKDNRANVVIPENSAITVRLVTPRRQAN